MGAVPAYNRGRPYEQRQGDVPLAAFPWWLATVAPRVPENYREARPNRHANSALCQGSAASEVKVCH